MPVTSPGLSASLLFGLGFLVSHPVAGIDITTAQYDRSRSTSNAEEIYLTRANVNGAKFGKVFARNVDGAIFAQPLYLESVKIKGKTLNLVYVATMHNMVYAFDADNPSAIAPVWSRNLGAFTTPSGWSTGMGIGGTPVINRSLDAIFVVAATMENGHRVFRLQALDIATGALKNGSSVIIGGQVPGSAPDGVHGAVSFQPDQQVQRAGLALAGNCVYIAFSADRDQVPYHGWVFGYDMPSLTQKAIYNTSPNATYNMAVQGAGYASGIWQSGRAPAVDDLGALYFETGNGDHNAVSDFGNSVLKLATNGFGGLALADWFTPSNFADLNKYDLDLGSTGPMLISGTNLVLAGSKTGDFYLLNRSGLGHMQAGDSQIAQHFLGADSCPPFDFQKCSQIMGQAFAFSAATPTLYVWPVHDRLRAYQFVNGRFLNTPSSLGLATSQYPGGVLAHSTYHAVVDSGIVWALTSDVPDNGFYFGPGFIGPGTVRAFDSSDLTRELWNSSQNPLRDSMGNMASFTTPLIANGKLFVPTLSNQLAVYGLLDGPVSGDANGDSVVSCADVQLVRATLGLNSNSPGFDARADVVRDGIINNRDLNLVTKNLPSGTTCR